MDRGNLVVSRGGEGDFFAEGWWLYGPYVFEKPEFLRSSASTFLSMYPVQVIICGAYKHGPPSMART